jgi:hypothetical protein
VRKLRRASVVLASLALAAGLYVRLLAGGPVGPLPGGALSGEPGGPVEDWSFANAHARIAVESRAGWLPYSISTGWFLAHEGRLYLVLPSLFGDGLQRRLARDPAVRVRLGERVHAARATRVEDESELAGMLVPFLRRALGLEVSGSIERLPPQQPGSGVELWIYRIASSS